MPVGDWLIRIASVLLGRPQAWRSKPIARYGRRASGRASRSNRPIVSSVWHDAHARTTNTRPRRAFVAYHGTPSVTNARDILRNGWLAGSGNALGDGIYLSLNINEAKRYATSDGVVIKCIIRPKRSCSWTQKQDHQFCHWCKRHAVKPDNSARTAFLRGRGFDVLRQGNTLVVLRPQFVNPSAYKFRPRGLRIVGVYHAVTDRRLRV